MTTSTYFLNATTTTTKPTCNEAQENLCSGLQALFPKDNNPEYNIEVPSESAWVWASLGFFLPLAIFGTIGNIVTIVMFAKYVKKTTTSIFIICLAIVDLVACGILMPLWFSELILGDIPLDFLCKLSAFLSFFIIPMSGCILLVIAVDRFLIIFVAKTTIITRLKAKVIIAALFVICFGFSVPQFFIISTIFVVPTSISERYCQGRLKCDLKKCRNIDRYLPREVNFDFWVAIMVFFLIMVICFSVMYSLIFVKVYRMHKKMLEWRSSLNRCPPPHNVQIDKNTFASTSHAIQEDNHVEMEAMLKTVDSPNLERVEACHNKTSESTNAALPKQLVIARRKKCPAHLRTAVTLSLVTCSFIVAYAPMIVSMFTKPGEPSDEKNNRPPKNSGLSFVWNMLFLNHVLNPIIYSFMNPRFKDAVKGLVKRKSGDKFPS